MRRVVANSATCTAKSIVPKSGEGGVRRWQGRIGTWAWDSGDDLNAGDDATLFRVGPLSLDLMEKVESGEVSLALRFGVFRYASLRDAYARYQIPFIQRRAASTLFFYALWRTAWTIHFSLSGGSKRKRNMFFFQGADWRNGMGVMYLYLSFALVASLPMIARQQERATSSTARTITCLAASPRTPDVVMALVVAGYLLLIPRVWNDNDPFDLLHADYEALDTQTLFSVVAVFLAIAVRIKGTHPIMDPDEATRTVLILCAAAPSQLPLPPMTSLACAPLFMIRSPCAQPCACYLRAWALSSVCHLTGGRRVFLAALCLRLVRHLPDDLDSCLPQPCLPPVLPRPS